MSRALKAIPPGILAFVAYLVFTGSVSIYDLVTGAIVAAVAGYLTAEILVTDYRKALNPIRLLWLIIYGFYYLTVAELKAHLHVAALALNPKMPIKPGIVRVPFKVENDYSIVSIANSITNTPGTVVVDLNKEKKVYYVHWITVISPDPETTYKNISEPFERYISKVFEGGESK